jgi:hypothetical protein
MNVDFTTTLSIVIQIITCIIGIHGLYIDISDKHKILQSILTIETVVQIIELTFYVFILRKMTTTSLNQMATIRYYDWVITTPIMLFTSALFFRYEQIIKDKDKKQLTMKDFIQNNYKTLSYIFISNLLMLFIGYLGEIGIIDKMLSVFVGFIFFGFVFYIIYRDYALPSGQLTLYYIMTIVWGLYGVAAIFEADVQNNILNMLDIIAKNFFGIFIYYIIMSRKN